MAERSWSLANVFRGVFGGVEQVTEETWDDLESALLTADFGPDVTESILDELRVAVERHRVTDVKELRRMLRDEIEEGRELYRTRVAGDLYERTNFFDRAVVDIILKSKGHVKSKIW